MFSSLFSANISYLGALTDSSVKVTSGAFPFGIVAFPKRTTVSPLRTFLTRAIPLEGRIVGRGIGATEAMINIIYYPIYKSKKL
jgi:hypothetical protein